MDRRLKKQLKTLQKYRKFLLPILSGLICVSILLVFIISRVHYRQAQAAATPSFHKTSILSGWAYQSNSANPLQVSVKSTNADDAVKIQYQQSNVSFGVPLANATVTQSKPNELEYTAKSKEVKVKYTIEPSRLKEAIILAQAPKNNSFTIPIKLNKAEIQLAPDNTPVIVDSKDKHYLFHIEKPFAVDANGVVTYAAKYRLETKDKQPKTITYPNDPGKMTLLGAHKPISIPSKQYRLVLEVDPEWLNDPARAYPVTIDPTVVHDATSEFATGQFNRVNNSGTTIPDTVASGGTISYASGYTIHTFTSSGTFTPTTSLNVEYLIVGGGGGGGGSSGSSGGGGGGGGYVTGSGAVTAQAYTVTVGTGGAGGAGADGASGTGANGNNSSFNSNTAYGGGGGSGAGSASGSNGGSGGGAGIGPGVTTGGTGSQGNNGGNGGGAYTGAHASGGGGGAGATGAAGNNTTGGGAGGIGISNSISGTATYYAGGGGGGSYNVSAGAGGTGGGGNGAIGTNSGSAGAANTGGGGGGSGWSVVGGAGGSGVVIIRYPTTYENSPSLETYYQEQTTDINTVGLWHFNEASGNALDSSGNGNTGTPTGTTVVAGILNNARSFNGTSDYITVTSALLDRSDVMPLSVSAWVKFNNLGSIAVVMDKGQTNYFRYTLQKNASDKAVFSIIKNGFAGVDALGSTTLSANTWYHLTGTFDGTTNSNSIKIYVDGKLDGFATYNQTGAIASTGTLRIGSTYLGTGGFFNGIIDEVVISGRLFSPEEIKAAASRRPSSTYTSPVIDFTKSVSSWNPLSWTESGVSTGDGETPYSTTGLVAQWNFNETSGTTADNAQGTAALDGTLTNFASTASQDQAALTGWTSINRRWGAGALMLDGSNDYVSVTNTSALNPSTITIETWFKGSAINGTNSNYILGKYNTASPFQGYGIRAHNNLFKCWVGGSAWTAGTTNVVDNQWHYGVCTYDGTNTKVYVDGKLEATQAQTATLTHTSNLSIGSYNSPSNYWNGVIDSIRIYSRALSSSEILSNYNAGTVELQTRVGASADPNDGTWEAWRPSTSETQQLALDSDSGNWSWDSTATYMPKSLGSDTVIKQEGASSLKLTNQTQVDASTVGLWHLDETSGTGAYIKDSSANANHGTPTGTTIVNGVSGKARSFNGSSDYVLIPASSAFDLQQLTIEAWVNPTIIAQNGFIFEKTTNGSVNTQYSCFLNGDGTFYFRTYNSSGTADDLTFTSSTYITANKWNHIACTYNGSTKAVYVNGAIAASKSYSQVLQTNPAGTSIIGAYGSGTSYFFSGKLDEVRISSTARSAEEIAEAYRMGRDHYLNRTISSTDLSGSNLASIKVAADRPGNYLALTYGESSFANYQSDANTAALYHLDEHSGSGAYIKDAGPNSYHVTPTGTTSVLGKIGKGRYFNGTSSDYLTLSSSLDAPIKTGSFTISGWLNASSFTNEAVLLTRGLVSTGGVYYGMAFNMSSAGLNFNRWVGSTAVPELIYAFTPATNTWYFAAVSYDKSTGTTNLYINGQLVKSGTLSTSNVAYHASYDLGYASGALRRNVSDRYSNAIIDELRIDSAVRSADDIRQAYESGLRTHSLTIDFGAKLDSGNLITSTSDLSFTIDATALGLNQKGSQLFLGDKIIVKENVDGTEYIAQGTVNSVDSSTGAVTVSAWDTGSTFPSGGFTANASVFKWQTAYINLNKSMSNQRNAVANLTLRLTDGNEGRTVYLDDFRSITNYLTANTSSTITSSTGNRYMQYRALLASTDETVSPALTSVTLDYINSTVSTPTFETTYQTDKIKIADQTPEFRFSSTDPNNYSLVYEVQWDTNSAFSTATSRVSDTDVGFTNITTPADTSPFNSGNIISFIPQSNLTNNTTYFYRVRTKDPDGLNVWTDWSSTKSLTIDTSLTNNQWFETHAGQFTTDTLSGDMTVSATNHNATIPSEVLVPTTLDAMEYATDTTAQAAYVTNGSAIESGGTITYTDSSGANPRSSPRYPGGYAVHTFTGSGTFTSSYAKTISALVVAGGGSGGAFEGGGGGGGGLVYNSSYSLSAGSHTITVGNGGVGASSYGAGNRGSNSSIGSLIVATGGGGGGTSSSGGATTGGSGGGGGGRECWTGGAAGTSGQGNSGGNGACTQNEVGGGGGGAGEAGGTFDGVNPRYGYGGNGLAYSISGTSTYYAGGGGGGARSGQIGTGGLGGGGAGGGYAGVGYNPGTPNTGGGSGGGNYNSSTSAAGGSGIVILRYASDPYLESYSESTIKSEGSYALKGVAAITNSLNKTLTRTIGSPLNLSDETQITFDIRATRTGSNIMVGLHDTGGTTTEVTPNITSANVFQTVTLDISGVANTNKDAIDKIIITIVNADATNTFYIDNLQSGHYRVGTGSILSTPITASNIRTASHWKTLSINQTNGSGNMTYQIYYDVAGTPTLVPDSALSGNSTGFSSPTVNLASLTTASYPILYIKANMTYSTAIPTLEDWTVSLNDTPAIPSLDAPTNNATYQLLSPSLKTTSTDIDNDELQYKIILCSNAAMTTNCQTFDQTSDQTGWSASSYASGVQATYTLQSSLARDTTYYWQSYALDPNGTNTWSSTQSTPYMFITAPIPPEPTNCRIQEHGTDTSLTPTWTDNSSNEDGFEVQRSVDGSEFFALTTLVAGTTTYLDSAITQGHTYQYRIAAYLNGPLYSDWCITPTLSLQSGSMGISGLKMQGIQIK